MEHELEAAAKDEAKVAVFTHTYPADLREGADRLLPLLKRQDVLCVYMSHTHYNELTNDGGTIDMATRLTGQIEEGPAGFSIAAIDGGCVSWRFVLITKPADRGLLTHMNQMLPSPFIARAKVIDDAPIETVEARLDLGDWVAIKPVPDDSTLRQASFNEQGEMLTVRTQDTLGPPMGIRSSSLPLLDTTSARGRWQRPRSRWRLAGEGHFRSTARPEPQREEMVTVTLDSSQNAPPPDGEALPSAQSLRGLDGINFFMADVRDGVGPYLSVFLKGGEHWDSGAIGIAMAVSSITAAICQVPAGLLVDAAQAKRLLIAASGLMIALGCILIVSFPNFGVVVAAQALLGAASAIIPPAIASLSLGLVARRLLDGRVSRNESFNHGGNFVAAGLVGLLGQSLGYQWIFYLVCAFAVVSAGIVMMIKPCEINHRRARGEDPDDKSEPVAIRDLFRRRDLRIFLVSVVLFHFGNAAMLPMAGQVLAQTHPGSDTMALSACIIAAQLVMVGVAWSVGRASAKGVGRKTIFLVALAMLPVRGILFSFTTSPVGVVAIQLLDGVAAGIFGVISVLIASDLMRGTGRFNLAQGLTALAVGIGAALSNATAGFVVQGFGYTTGFLYLGTIALCALAFFALFMPETRDKNHTPDVQPRADRQGTRWAR